MNEKNWPDGLDQDQPITEWHKAAGTAVEVRRSGVIQHRGFVDDVMVDGSGVWLASYGISLRVFVPRQEDLELWPAPAP